ncbi:MAG TPA: hypothetical protein PKA95_06695, partial [Thermomicrobiales bacterium]|nr:hypothetical protein [Thermomicrobiales bacterium]
MRRRTRVIACVLALMLLLPAGATAAGAGEDAFARTWARTDQPVASGEVARTWVWGPQSFAAETEEYAESPSGTRAVRYFDKSRMEVTHPDAVDDGLWYVTNGLLVVELITGRMQIGDDAFVQRLPAEINVAGDQGFENGPTYATFRPLADRSEYQQKPGDRDAALVVERIDAAGLVTTADTLAGQGVRLAFYDDITGHNIAAPFWEFMNADGLVETGGELAVERLFVNPYYAAGRPITEPYWSDVVVAGTKQLVLLQCFERRCLTYTPGNEPGWRVEAGNVGRHYHQWRYAEVPEVAGQLMFYRTQYDPEAGQSTTDIYTINAEGTDERNLTAEFGLNARF